MCMNVTTKDFLQLLFGKCTEGCITITTLPGSRNEHIPVQELDRAAEQIMKYGMSANTYYGLALRCAGLPETVRGSVDEVQTVVCMYADIDVRGPEHVKENLPETREEAVGFVNGLAMKPSILVNSGNGIHALWLLDEPFVIHNEEERQYIRDVSAGFGIYVIQEGIKKGWKLDNVQDIPRMLRAPGSLNFKSDPPKKCEVLTAEDIRYSVKDFEKFKPTIEKSVIQVDHSIVGPAERMQGQCKFIDHCIEDAKTLSEPEWHTFLSIVAVTENGEEKAHEWSEPYPGYSYEQTQSYYERAAKMNRPCSCRYIHDGLGFECPKGGCGVKAPIVFAYYSKEEQIEKLLEKELTLDDIFDKKTLLLANYASVKLPVLYTEMRMAFKKVKGVNLNYFDKKMKNAVAETKAETSAEADFAGLDTTPDLEDIDTGELVVPGGWQVDMSGVKKEEFKEGIPYLKLAFSAPVLVTRQLTNIDNGEMKLELMFRCNARWKKIIVPRGDVMDKGKLVKYANQGLPVTSETSKECVNYLEAFERKNRKTIPLHRSIERMGWIGNKEFFPYHMESEAVYDGASEESHRILAAIVPCGNKEKWLEMAAQLRTMQAARVMLAASFASVLLQPLQQRPFIFHLWANSRSGKTAALKAAVSIYGNPNVLLRSYNSTAVGIERTAATVRNIPLALDELQSLSMKAEYLSRMTYMLGNGIGKMRGDRVGGTQRMQTWCNTILSTGEQPITVESSMDGENTRVMELYASPIGDTDFARKVHQTVEENYGFAGQEFVNYLFREFDMGKGVEKLRKEYGKFREEFISAYEMLYEKCTSIYLEFVAVLVFADYISSKAVFEKEESNAFGEAFEMGTKFLQDLKKEQKADAVERAWDAVKEWAASNQEHFENKISISVQREPLFGRYDPKIEKLYILPNCLRKMLDECGFSYEKSVKGFKERGYIEKKQETCRVGAGVAKVICADIQFDHKRDEDVFL